MVELPFQQPQALNVRQNRALALAAVFQATQLTHMTAMAGQQSIGESGNFYFEQLIKASLISDQSQFITQTLDFFNQLGRYFLRFKNIRK
jgi:high frequency lysogenization protein